MKSKPIHRLCALALALLMLLPMVSVPTFAERKVTYGTQDFESFSAGQTLTKADGFSTVAPINQVLEEDGNKFLRLPIASEDASNPKSGTTNRGLYFQLSHQAFSTTEKTSIKMNLRMHGVGGSKPNVGVWLQNVSYKDSNGVTQKRQWYRFFDVNLLTGELTFNSVTGTKTGATGLKSDVWNTVEVIFDPADGSFDIYINDVLYANCTAPVTGTEFAVPANVLMYAVCSSNDTKNYTAISDLDDDYGNANYMDADRFVVSTADVDAINALARQGFERFESGKTLTKSDGFAQMLPFNKVLEEDCNRFLRVPIAKDSASGTTNKGNWLYFAHGTLPTDEKISIRIDLRMHGADGAQTPNIGIWAQAINYKDASGTSKTQSWYRFFDVNLLTGEFTFHQVNGTKTGATGLKAGVWNTVEVLFDPSDGSFDVYMSMRFCMPFAPHR